MKVTLLGLPQAGQQQLFSLLTGIATDQIIQKPLEVHQGICDVKDPRITRLVEMYKPQKTAYAKIEYLLLPDFNLKGPQKELLVNQVRNADELCFIVRSETAKEDISNFISELIITDMVLAEKRIDTINKDKKKNQPDRDKEKALMEICYKQLNEEKLLSSLTFDNEQKKTLKPYQFLTLKPIVIVINIPEDKIKDHSFAENIKNTFHLPTIQLSVNIEGEISQLEAKDRPEFMKELGIEEPALDKMTRLTYEGLGLISYFTVGEDEVRAWTVAKGASAPEAAGVIHTNIQKGFVRAEMFTYDDLIAVGSEAKLKEIGKFHLKGKDYIVQDGDILSFRSSI